jgi:hypothetical protein
MTHWLGLGTFNGHWGRLRKRMPINSLIKKFLRFFFIPRAGMGHGVLASLARADWLSVKSVGGAPFWSNSDLVGVSAESVKYASEKVGPT